MKARKDKQEIEHHGYLEQGESQWGCVGKVMIREAFVLSVKFVGT